MMAHSPRDRSRSPHNHDNSSSSKKTSHSNKKDSSSPLEPVDSNNKIKKDIESTQRMKNLKTFIQTLINESTSLVGSFDEQMKALENACMKEYHDLPIDRIRRMIRSSLKLRKSQPSSSTHSHSTSSFPHKDRSKVSSTSKECFNSNETNNNKTSDLISSTALSVLDADFLRHAFSQQYRPSLDLSAYFSAAATSPNGTNSTSSLFRPNFSSTNFLQSTLAPPPLPPPPPPTFVSSHTHTNGISDSSSMKSSKPTTKLSNSETNSIKVLVNAYREAASYLSRSADELEQLI